MREWFPIPPLCCDGPGLNGMHKEAHQIEQSILDPTRGWQYHPEVNRWRGRLPALAAYHAEIVAEARRRGWPSGFKHRTPMVHPGEVIWPEPIEPVEVMRAKLAMKIAERLARKEAA